MTDCQLERRWGVRRARNRRRPHWFGFAVSLLVGWGLVASPLVSPAFAAAEQPTASRADASQADVDQGADGESGDVKKSSLGMTRRQTLITSLTIFVLAVFVGFEVITKVPPTLHTPLMSGSNAVSGITIVGAILVAGTAAGIDGWIGFVAVILAAVNVFGGFLVTHRMLAMFQRR